MNTINTEELLAATRATRYPWILLGLLWLVSFLNSADRAILIAVMPQIRAQFGLSPTQLALISSSFFWIYAIAALFSGRIGDRAPRSRVILYGLAFWSLATGTASLATGVGMLIALRGLVALGESTYYPAATALISDWHAPHMRSRTLSLHQTAVFAGAGLGALTAGVIADRFGWRMPYIIYGVAGVALCFVLRKGLRDAPLRNAASLARGQQRTQIKARAYLKMVRLLRSARIGRLRRSFRLHSPRYARETIATSGSMGASLATANRF
jgi:MFS family permease